MINFVKWWACQPSWKSTYLNQSWQSWHVLASCSLLTWPWLEFSLLKKLISMSESVAKVVFIRHGESQGNAKNVYTGWDDTPLSIKGEQEAEEAGLCLKAKGVKFDIVFTSALQLLGQQNHKLRSFCSWWFIQYCWKLQFLSFPSSFLLRFCFTSHQSYPIIPPHPAAVS